MSAPRTARGGKEDVERVATPPFPAQFYPMPGYQGPPWFPGQGPPPPWAASWSAPPMGFPAPPAAWSSPQAMMPSSSTSTTAAMPSDEYTVDTMRRIYNDDDGRVEIQRVKVQRRPPDAGALPYPSGPEAMSVVPVGSFPLNERRPPPRKKKQLQALQAAQGQGYPWYPYMPCMPYPVPYPYYYGGCMWSPGAPTGHSVPAWSGHDESERTSSRQDSLPTTLDSQRLESRASDPLRGSISPVSQRSPSPAAGSHVTDAHSLAPSDSVSMRGYKRESSLERALMCPTPPPRTKSRSAERKSSADVGKMQEWMVDMHKAILASGDGASDADKSSFATAPTDVDPYKKLPPRRKNRAARLASLSERSSLSDHKDMDDALEKRSITSIGSDDSLKLSSELTYAFKKLEQSVDAFKTKVSSDSTPVHTPQRLPSPPPLHSSGEETPTEAMEDAVVSLDVTDAEKSVTLAKSDAASEDPSSPPPLETISPTFFNEATTPQTPKEEDKQIVAKAEETPSSQTTSDTSSSQTSVATTLQTTDVSATPASEAEPTKTTPTASPPEAKDTPTALPQPTDATQVSPSTEKPPEETQNTPQTNETPPTATATEKQVPASDQMDSSHPPLPSEIEAKANEEEASGRESRASESTFFSIRASDDQLLVDTDSTDILLPTTDATTADEGEEHIESAVASPTLEDNEGYQWVLQQPGETPELTGAKEDEQRNAWRAEVSLWRARLVVSLCRGRGLDRQDWSTFHLLVRHPLTLDLKLSLLHAPRLCAANSTVGAALVRVALIHLAQYGEALLQPDSSRQTGWRSIKVDPNQSWAPVKGAIEILQALGYKQREDGILRYPRRSNTEVSVLARLTLDMLVLAEELRLYLTGMHQYPTNISDLFFSATSPIAPSPDPVMQDVLQRPQSSASSYSFLSAQSNASLDKRPESRASISDEETETLQESVQQTKGPAKKPRRDSSSEEEVTLREEIKDVKGDSTEAIQDELAGEMPTEEAPLPAEVLRKKEDKRSGSVLALPLNPIDRSSLSTMTSMPDLQSLRSSTISRDSPLRPESNNSAAPAGEATTGSDNPEDHIYEEIDVIRAQVQALRSASVPAHTPPPPLPPKKKVSSGGEDDSNLSITYPSMEWTSASTPGSLRGGSTGARRKKRRAPMPPDFMPPDWRPYQNRSVENASSTTQDQASPSPNEMSEEERKRKEEYRRSLNPFYEDIDSVKEKVKELQAKEEEKNPFVKEDVVVAGYIGKNPFYEDVEPLKKDAKGSEEIKKNKDYEKLQITRKGENGKLSGMGSLAELQDDSVQTRPKRKAPRPPPTPDPTSASAAENTSVTASSSEIAESTTSTQQPSSTPQPPTSSRPPSAPPRPPTPRSSSIPRTASTPQPSTDQSTSQPPSTPQRPPTPKRASTPRRSSTQGTPIPPDTQSQGEQTKNAEADDAKPPIPAKLRNGEKNNDSSPSETAKSTANEPQSSPPPQQDGKEPETQKEEARQVISKAIKNQQQRIQLQHPKTPPPPPPSSSKPAPPPSDTQSAEEKKEDAATTPPRDSLAFLDDIPYMDANEVKDAKTKPSDSKDQQSSQYEIPEPPGKVLVPAQLSPTVMRQTALLLRGSRTVPFIDESDLPPDCPPPPPPGPPPDSPPTSPPETPHTSPPETPHTSPPETPQGSPVPSRVNLSATTTTPGVKKTETDKPTDTRPSQKAEDKDQPPALPPKTTSTSSTSPKAKITEIKQTTEQTKASEDKQAKSTQLQDSNEKEEPKKEHETLSSQPSVRSSVSEDRYEIPDTSKPPATSPDSSQSTKTESGGDSEGKPGESNEPASVSDKREIPEATKESVVEERYEIPEVVKETAINGGASSVPRSFLGPAVSPGRGNLEAVFGPPKPPRRRRNHHSPPPPRPPKSSSLDSSWQPKLPPKVGSLVVRPGSTTSSFSTTSGTTSGSTAPTPSSMPATPRPVKGDKAKPARKSWPFLLCDCLYANCRTYDNAK